MEPPSVSRLRILLSYKPHRGDTPTLSPPCGFQKTPCLLLSFAFLPYNQGDRKFLAFCYRPKLFLRFEFSSIITLLLQKAYCLNPCDVSLCVMKNNTEVNSVTTSYLTYPMPHSSAIISFRTQYRTKIGGKNNSLPFIGL